MGVGQVHFTLHPAASMMITRSSAFPACRHRRQVDQSEQKTVLYHSQQLGIAKVLIANGTGVHSGGPRVLGLRCSNTYSTVGETVGNPSQGLSDLCTSRYGPQRTYYWRIYCTVLYNAALR